MTKKQKKTLWRILAAALMLLCLYFLPVTGWAKFGLYLLPYLTVGWDLLRKAAKGILRGQVLDENFLMAVATVGALVIGLVRTGDYVEAVAVMLFFQIGELFESYAVGKSRKNITRLMDIRPDYANMEADGVLVQTDPDQVAVGSIIVVRPGEKIPIDGVVTEGTSELDTAALTGESMPRRVQTGDEVVSGCVNMTGLLNIQTTREFGESTVSRILELVENASSRKSRSEAFISRFAKFYTPAVCIAALALAVLPPVVSLLLRTDPQWSQWLYRALSFLVASCPCALVISIPLSFFAGIGGASREGILIKGSNYLEALSKADCVVMDKTGTLTQGTFSVSRLENRGIAPETFLEYAVLAESASSHPISKSLQHSYGKPFDRSRVSDIREISGEGVTALVDGCAVAVGNNKLMTRMGLTPELAETAGTVVHLAVDGQYRGYLVISDILKENSAEAIRQLGKAGVKKTVMLTGDNAATASAIAGALGIRQVCSRLLPDEKVEQVEKLLRQQPKGKKLVFVGDGINDAPVLSRADIGIAMGALGSDAAIEAADIVLMDDDPLKIPKAIRISRKCLGIVYQNIVFAIGIKALSLVLVALGMASMWLAIFADVGVMVLAVLNAIRALFVKKA